VLDGGPDRHGKQQCLGGKGTARCKLQGHTAVSCGRAAEPIEMSFGMWTRVVRRKYALDGVHIGATWRIQLNRP